MRRHFEVKFGIWRKKSGGEGRALTRIHPAGAAGVRSSSQTTLSLCFCAGKAASFQSPGPGRSRTPVLGGGVQPEPVCVGLGAAQWRRAWSLSERAASSKIGSLRSFSGSGHRDLKRDQRDRFPPQTVAVAGPSGPRRVLTSSQKLVSATLSRVSGLEAEDGSLENKQWQR